ncbi:ABC transporter permease [Longispora albida]|uniref:ABC transporter permease n=1 Tax=Longispora albida TaxID=203523 RepID=UPI000365D9D5|nr:ABC transporter permease [Longispora albida]
MNWQWVRDHIPDFADKLGLHTYLSVMPVLYGLLIAIPLGVACARWPRLYPPVTGLTSTLYALPSVALFMLLLDVTGLSNATVIIPLTVYSLAVLVPNVVDGLRSVPEPVRQSAAAMGFGPVRRLVQVELPVAVPVVMAGLRIATVSNISVVSVGALVGIGGLGQLFTDGLQRDFMTPIVCGIVLTVLLAIAFDGLLVLGLRFLTPWARP